METHTCPKCNAAMDEGYMSWSGSGSSGYVSKKQTGMVRKAATIRQARACLNCGYVEMYLDLNGLKKNIS